MAFLIAAIVIILLFTKSPEAFNKYSAFGIYMPMEFPIHGIDVSRYQGNINWQMIKDVNIDNIKITFAFIKATEGISIIDPMFTRNWQACKKAGITRGAYHFFRADEDGTLQAKNFIACVKLEAGDLPPVVDIEQLNNVPKSLLLKELKEFMSVVEKYYQAKPILYTYVSFYKENLQNELDDYPLWIAHYKLENRRPQLGREWNFWQHSERGNVSGINVKTDFNVFYGDSTLFNEMLVK